MKRILSILLVLVLAASLFAVSALADAENPAGITGGWSAPESPEITEDLQALMDKAAEGLLGVDYVPVAYLGRQIVAGTNHCILCQATAVYPDAEPYYALVYIYEDLNGGTEILNIVALDVGEMLYSGEETASVENDGQNPVMNFVGEYQCDRAHAVVRCAGENGAEITIDWGSSATELAHWEITGPLDTETLTVEYSDSAKSIVTYDNDGNLVSEEVEYEDGTGTIVFHEDGTFTWKDDQSEYEEDLVFEWLPVEAP